MAVALAHRGRQALLGTAETRQYHDARGITIANLELATLVLGLGALLKAANDLRQ